MAATANALMGLSHMSTIRQFVMLVMLAGSVALGVTVVLWSQTPNYTLLYGSLSGKEASDVLGVLERESIPYRVEHDTGAIMVASGKVHEARLKLAGDGLPRGAEMGFQILEEERSFGDSQFMEQARYHRALEVELARSVASLDKIESARVHLALPKESAFLRNRKPPSASVLLKLYGGRVLEPGEAAAISHLVAAAIPNLEATAVQVIDERGRLLTSTEPDSAIGSSNKEFDFTERLEEAYRERIERLLGAIVGPQSVKAQVTAELDFTRTEQARESFSPNPEAIRSERLLEENASENGATGIPGALSNQPPAAGNAPEVAVSEGNNATLGAESRIRKQSTRNYELDRVVDHTVTPGAKIGRLSVAIVVDDKPGVNEAGEPTREPRSAEEMAHYENLVKEAIGYDEERGDRVRLINTSFVVTELSLEELPPEPLWKQPYVLELGKQAAGGLLVLLLAFGLLRPVMKNLVNRDLVEREMLLANEQQVQLSGPGAQAQEAGGVTGLVGRSPEDNLETIRTLVAEDPRRVANVMKTWVDGNG